METTKMSVEQIREILVTEHTMSVDEVRNIKGKSNLVNKLLELEGSANMKTSFEIVDIDNLNTEPCLTRQDSNWTKYILDQLVEDEKDGIYPKSDGLRRLLEKEVSHIVTMNNMVIQSPQPANGMIATVQCNIELENGERYTALADAKKDDLDAPYNKHVTAIAETRAEGRVFRKALRLKNTATKEEMIDKKEEETHKINKNQIALIDGLCINNRLNINVKKLLALLFDDKVKNNIKEYSYDEAVVINQKLTEYQKDINNIPPDIRGYDVSWKD